eukprot:snap_masked-scaffold263_size232787-processed-gene-1.16 protein:Tk11210 transcript:snap_masked-scaffold263_size232787-processed-gene-1.16-mRNA-1 annotation:"conserved hypothetical protein"
MGLNLPEIEVISADEIRGVMGVNGHPEDSFKGVFIPKPGSNVIVDDSPLQNQMQRNKESLKVKLMVRRPFDTLVEQGIVPSPKTSPALHEQRQKLERAKMGDMLRAKIAKRPDRQELVHRHILEDVPMGVDPSLCDKQRQLKRAKLADSLSNQLQLRPGPLELIQKNILHTDDTVEQAVKEGQIHFRPTNHGLPYKHVDLPHDYTIVSSFDEDSSDGGVQSPPSSVETVQKSDSTDSVFPVPPVTPGGHERRLSDVGQFAVPSPPSLSSLSTSSSSSKISSSSNSLTNQAYSQRGAPGKERKIKKPKAKTSTSKPRTIKFHEYKGPTSIAQKRPNSVDAEQKSADDSRYELLLEQQQLFLQWQLELSHKYPQILLPAAPSSLSMSSSTSTITTSPTTTKFTIATQSSMVAKYQPQLSSGSSQTSSNVPSPGSSASPTPRATTPSRTLVIGFGSNPASIEDSARLLEKMEAMKVTDLKSELKKRSLPTSGSKNALIERLKPHLEAMIAANGGTLRLKLGVQPATRATSVGRGSKETSPMTLGPEGTAMDVLSQPGTPMMIQEHMGTPSPMSNGGESMHSPLRSILVDPASVVSPRTMDFDHFDLDLMDTDRALSSPSPHASLVTTTSTNHSSTTVVVSTQGTPTIITLPKATRMIPATLPTVLPKPPTSIPPPPPPPPPPLRRGGVTVNPSPPSFTITPVLPSGTPSQLSIQRSQPPVPVAQLHTSSGTRADPIVIHVPQPPKMVMSNGILGNGSPISPPSMASLSQPSPVLTSPVTPTGSLDLIREQQRKIEELQSALAKSQSQILEQAKILTQQQTQLNAANNNPINVMPDGQQFILKKEQPEPPKNANHVVVSSSQNVPLPPAQVVSLGTTPVPISMPYQPQTQAMAQPRTTTTMTNVKIENDPLVEEMLSMLAAHENHSAFEHGSTSFKFGNPPPPPPPPYNVTKPSTTPPLNELLSFDINDFELPVLETIEFAQPMESGSVCPANGGKSDGMEVDQDVADWLDSLLPQNSNCSNDMMNCSEFHHTHKPLIEEELNGNVQMWNMDPFTTKPGSSQSRIQADFLTDESLSHFL